jgi:predicted DNA-binding ArsR family transcriptional regulator
VWRHLVEDGKPVFSSLDEALAADAHTVTAIAKEVEKLYSEGRD